MNFSQKLVRLCLFEKRLLYFRKTKISEFVRLGPLTTKDANVALQVYLELCEVKKYWDVDYKFHNELQLLYFTAKKCKSEDISVFIPRCSSDDLSYNEMYNYFKITQNLKTNCVFLVFVTSDSTCVYYQISEGLNEPPEAGTKKIRSHLQEKRDASIRKYRNVISEAALCGTVVTIRDSNQESSA